MDNTYKILCDAREERDKNLERLGQFITFASCIDPLHFSYIPAVVVADPDRGVYILNEEQGRDLNVPQKTWDEEREKFVPVRKPIEVGERVCCTDSSECYTTYTSFMVDHCDKDVCARYAFATPMKELQEGEVIGVYPHGEIEGEMLAIVDTGLPVYLVCVEGLMRKSDSPF